MGQLGLGPQGTLFPQGFGAWGLTVPGGAVAPAFVGASAALSAVLSFSGLGFRV